MNIDRHRSAVADAAPSLFLARAGNGCEAAIEDALTELHARSSVVTGLIVVTRLSALASDQSSPAALNIAGLMKIDTGYVLAMRTATISIFAIGLLLQRRREYVTLLALGFIPARSGTDPGRNRHRCVGGLRGRCSGRLVMAWYLIDILQPLFVQPPQLSFPLGSVGLVFGALVAASILVGLVGLVGLAASRLVDLLQAAELLRDG